MESDCMTRDFTLTAYPLGEGSNPDVATFELRQDTNLWAVLELDEAAVDAGADTLTELLTKIAIRYL